MHRVELKVLFSNAVKVFSKVPNAPCGVESRCLHFLMFSASLFLMHRVELKVARPQRHRPREIYVPNAPCGVESRHPPSEGGIASRFLMHRVELKEACLRTSSGIPQGS